MLAILFGFIAGIVTGLGMGGGTILILLLSLFMGLEQHIAQATNLVFFVPTSLAAIIINLKQKNVNLKIAVIISIFGIMGSIIGSIISERISSDLLRKWFAIFVFMIALHEVYELYKEYKKNRKNA